jgi:predicted alpha/beta-fold hydrolase
VTFYRKATGHLWTIAPTIRERVKPLGAPASVPWSTFLVDQVAGRVRLTGLLNEVPGADMLVLIVHGLGGDADRPYCREAATAAQNAGASSLRLNVRGADRSGEDLMHAGLSADLHAALASPEVERHTKVALLGFSIGGHLSLKAATESISERVVGVAAVGSPLDLLASVTWIDRRSSMLYRKAVMGGLNEIYAAWAKNGDGTAPLPEVLSTTKLRTWDELTVVRRHGFRDTAHYYETQSAGPRLSGLEVPALYIGSRYDPMIPPKSVIPWLDRAGERVQTHFVDTGGHVNFPTHLDLGLGPNKGVAGQAIDWIRALPS